ncbi:MAG TPA: hypothetical protein PKN04_11320 [bacterium]|nr:hypothetical protein [bacterium]HNT66361.1 hypothetical protein [bacterium]
MRFELPMLSAPDLRNSIRIAFVYRRDNYSTLLTAGMSHLRFFRMAEALARRGYQVDIIINRQREIAVVSPNLREVPFNLVRWDEYSVIKTVFHEGMRTLIKEGGGEHPFIISKLGSVIASSEHPGVHFHGDVRQDLFMLQCEVAKRSRAVTVLTQASLDLFRSEHGDKQLFLIPTGVDAVIPEPGPNPYTRMGISDPVAIFAGNLYDNTRQPEVNRLWQERLNRLGRALKARRIQLVAMGVGLTNLLDPQIVLHVGAIENNAYWDWQRYAAVGIVLAQGVVQHNESSKIYYYLRTGLPVVCESPVPNAGLISRLGHGTLCAYDDTEEMADQAAFYCHHPPDKHRVMQRMIAEHSWDQRAAMYDRLLLQTLPHVAPEEA